MSNSIETIVSASSIEDLKALIKKAEGAIEEKKVGEIMTVREQMVKLAGTLDMTPQEILDFSIRKRRAPGVPKYRNPANPEQTWTGRGKKPGWLKQAVDQEALRIPQT
ncbi:MAG: H-NS histone family protein [Candidatus Contendobacter sp.]|jgi:DNA-binding protein H-NS|nr:H-NS histone family protein [Candidatus Contendobacter sp.]